ncbi:hypothetical protein JKP88DRAFT_287668 [Tribonema minus]|uniref:Uncharacterized protein n=1 Tax=Tribonema minus TaxID=303371 RepID=A0A836CK33_9STRA|nr:hypothetical protein JKP88DRAFT_287668 [Tribonema minus]
MATVLEQLLIPYLTTGSMGLYTSETDNTADLINIDDVWDGHQCIIFTTVITTGIDYNTLIHRIFIVPCANTATARDAFQQGGRGRNVLTNEIWIAVKEGAYQEALQKPLTRCEIDKTAQEEMDRIAAGGVIMARSTVDAAAALVLTIGAEAVTVNYRRAHPDLVVAAGYSSMESRFCATIVDYVRMMLYLLNTKGYIATTNLHPLPRAAREVLPIIKEEISSIRDGSKLLKQQAMDAIDVSGVVASKEDMRTLEALAARRRIPEDVRIAFNERYGHMSPSELRATQLKARTALMFPSVEALQLGVLAHKVERHMHVLQNIGIIERPDTAVRTLGFFNDAHKAPELGTIHSVPELLLLNELDGALHELRSLGCGVGVKGTSFRIVCAKKILKRALGLNVVIKKPTAYVPAVQELLDMKPTEGELRRTLDVLRKKPGYERAVREGAALLHKKVGNKRGAEALEDAARGSKKPTQRIDDMAFASHGGYV